MLGRLALTSASWSVRAGRVAPAASSYLLPISPALLPSPAALVASVPCRRFAARKKGKERRLKHARKKERDVQAAGKARAKGKEAPVAATPNLTPSYKAKESKAGTGSEPLKELKRDPFATGTAAEVELPPIRPPRPVAAPPPRENLPPLRADADAAHSPSSFETSSWSLADSAGQDRMATSSASGSEAGAGAGTGTARGAGAEAEAGAGAGAGGATANDGEVVDGGMTLEDFRRMRETSLKEKEEAVKKASSEEGEPAGIEERMRPTPPEALSGKKRKGLIGIWKTYGLMGTIVWTDLWALSVVGLYLPTFFVDPAPVVHSVVDWTGLAERFDLNIDHYVDTYGRLGAVYISAELTDPLRWPMVFWLVRRMSKETNAWPRLTALTVVALGLASATVFYDLHVRSEYVHPGGEDGGEDSGADGAGIESDGTA